MTAESTLKRAEARCQTNAVRLTGKRRRLLELLLDALPRPLSAYEICDGYREQTGESLAPMSAYRMLDSLVTAGVVHRLETANRYLACEHLACSHRHQTPQFLICDSCTEVRELGLASPLLDDLRQSSKKTGFQIQSRQIELHGLCANCQTIPLSN